MPMRRLQILITNYAGGIVGEFQFSWSFKRIDGIGQLELNNFIAVLHVVVLAQQISLDVDFVTILLVRYRKKLTACIHSAMRS